MARSFTSATDRAVSGSLATSAITNITYSIWANVTTSVADGDFFTNGVAATNGTRMLQASKVFEIILPSVTGGTLVTSFTFTIGTWAHTLFTVNGSNVITAYANGSNVGSLTKTTITPTTSCVIGNVDAASGNAPFSGSLADAAVWSTVLTQMEITALANGARPYTIRPGNLLRWWPLDGLQSPEPDLSGNAKNLTLTGSALAFGPPLMQLTPRWPINAPIIVPAVVAGKFNPARTMRANLAYTGFPSM